MTTIHDRLQLCIRRVAVLIAGLTADPDEVADRTSLSAQEIQAGLRDTAEEIYEELYWLTMLPADVLTRAAPNSDDQQGKRRVPQ
jgi:hypothetical protein